MEVLTLLEHAKRLAPDGKIAAICELLNETNEILDDMPFIESNLPTGHRTTVRTDLPSVTWRKLNYGVQPTKSKTKQIDDTTGMLEAYAEVDKELADLNGNTAEFRLSEDRAFIEAMNQTMAQTLIYGNTATHPERFLGLSPRYAYSDQPNVINAGGSGSDLTSMWLVCWGVNTVHGIFPKGSKAGLSHEDKGQVTLEDDAGGRYEGYRSHYQWKAGLVVRDWRYVVRIANLETTGTSNIMTTDLAIEALNTPPNLKLGKPVWYCNRTVKTQLDKAAANKSNAALTIKEVFGQPTTHVWNVPIRQVDSILDTEATLTAMP